MPPRHEDTKIEREHFQISSSPNHQILKILGVGRSETRPRRRKVWGCRQRLKRVSWLEIGPWYLPVLATSIGESPRVCYARLAGAGKTQGRLEVVLSAWKLWMGGDDAVINRMDSSPRVCYARLAGAGSALCALQMCQTWCVGQ